MKKLIAIAAVSMLALAGCGGSDADVLQSGTYDLSQVTLTSSLDECDIDAALRGQTMDIAVAGKDVTFFSNTQVKPIATVDDNDAFTGTAEGTFTDTGCNFKITKTVTGKVASDTEFSTELVFRTDIISGGAACTADITGFAAGNTCTSKFTFVAKKAAAAAAQ